MPDLKYKGISGPFSSASDLLKIQARPEEHEAILKRQGQFARMITAKKCPCIKNGRPEMFCTICKGMGFTINYQTSALVIDENSPHYGDFEVWPKGTPITRAIAVRRNLHDINCGNIDYQITGFNDNKITFSGTLAPKRGEKVNVTYEYSLKKTITNENPTHTGDYILITNRNKIKMELSANPFGLFGDICEVDSVYNYTQSLSYSVKNFYKNTIVIDDVNGTVPAPLASDVLKVNYKYIEPVTIATNRIDLENAIQKWGEDIKEGDIQAMIMSYQYINKGDIVTFLYPRLRTEEVIIRGTGQSDELPQFDVVEIIDDILDEDNVRYTSAKYDLMNYNEIKWKSGQGPVQGKRYTITFLYRPTYRIYKQNIDTMTNENKRFPHQVLLRFMNRFYKKDLLKV